MNAVVRGKVQIIGSAWMPESIFQFYKVDFGYGPDPDSWTTMGTTHETPVIDGVLETWHTEGLPDGIYSLRLHVVRIDGTYEEVIVRQIVVANVQPTETPIPTETPTPTPTITPTAATPTITIVQPTPTVIPPTPRPQPTLVPRSGVPDVSSMLSLDLGALGQAFCYGAAVSGMMFLLIGMVVLLRRFL